MEQEEQRIPKPKWLKVKLPTGENYRKVRSLVDEHKVATVRIWANVGEKEQLLS